KAVSSYVDALVIDRREGEQERASKLVARRRITQMKSSDVKTRGNRRFSGGHGLGLASYPVHSIDASLGEIGVGPLRPEAYSKSAWLEQHIPGRRCSQHAVQRGDEGRRGNERPGARGATIAIRYHCNPCKVCGRIGPQDRINPSPL